jgi:hypothetical protein
LSALACVGDPAPGPEPERAVKNIIRVICEICGSEVPFFHKSKHLQTGLYQHNHNTGAYDRKGKIQNAKEDNVFNVPLPFK